MKTGRLTMPASDQQPNFSQRLVKFPLALCALVLSINSFAGDGGFIGASVGTSSTLDADKTSTTFKLLTGAHITSRISLEFGYVNFGSTSYNDPEAINTSNNNKNISFKDASHGSISFGQLGDPTVIANTTNTYNSKSSSSFTGISEFTPHGGLINLRYRFPIIDSLDFFVKTGFFAWVADYEMIKITAKQSTEADNLVTETVKRGQASGVNAVSGGGFIYRPTPQLSLRAELESTAISSAEMPRTRLQNISFGANWEF
jgi:hypothetical protein